MHASYVAVQSFIWRHLSIDGKVPPPEFFQGDVVEALLAQRREVVHQLNMQIHQALTVLASPVGSPDAKASGPTGSSSFPCLVQSRRCQVAFNENIQKHTVYFEWKEQRDNDGSFKLGQKILVATPAPPEGKTALLLLDSISYQDNGAWRGVLYQAHGAALSREPSEIVLSFLCDIMDHVSTLMDISRVLRFERIYHRKHNSYSLASAAVVSGHAWPSRVREYLTTGVPAESISLKELNEAQHEALANAFKFNALHDLVGPPGTGKTFLLSALRHLLQRQVKLLLLAQGNSQVYRMVQGLQEDVDIYETIVVGSEKHMHPRCRQFMPEARAHLQPPVVFLAFLMQLLLDHGVGFVRQELNRVFAPPVGSPDAKASGATGFSISHKTFPFETTTVQMFANALLDLDCDLKEVWLSTADTLKDAAYTAAVRDVTSRARIVLGTLSSIRKIVAGFCSTDLVLLVGDEISTTSRRQLPRMLLVAHTCDLLGIMFVGDKAQGMPFDMRLTHNQGLSSSHKTFSRVVEKSFFQELNIPSSFLNVQHRCTATIGNLWSRVYYDSKVANSTAMLALDQALASPPLLLFDTYHGLGRAGVEHAQSGVPHANDTICRIALAVTFQLLKTQRTVFVVAFYTEQVKLLSTHLAPLLEEFGNSNPPALVVGTVSSIQGHECSTIVLAFERTAQHPPTPDALCSNALLVNVLLSRPREQVVLIGSSRALLLSPTWREVLRVGRWARMPVALDTTHDGAITTALSWPTSATQAGVAVCTSCCPPGKALPIACFSNATQRLIAKRKGTYTCFVCTMVQQKEDPHGYGRPSRPAKSA